MYEGLVLGLLTFFGFIIIIRKLPNYVKTLITNQKIIWVTDILLTIGSYLLLSGISSSLASAIGCAVTGILISIYLNFISESRKSPF